MGCPAFNFFNCVLNLRGRIDLVLGHKDIYIYLTFRENNTCHTYVSFSSINIVDHVNLQTDKQIVKIGCNT